MQLGTTLMDYWDDYDSFWIATRGFHWDTYRKLCWANKEPRWESILMTERINAGSRFDRRTDEGICDGYLEPHPIPHLQTWLRGGHGLSNRSHVAVDGEVKVIESWKRGEDMLSRELNHILLSELKLFYSWFKTTAPALNHQQLIAHISKLLVYSLVFPTNVIRAQLCAVTVSLTIPKKLISFWICPK